MEKVEYQPINKKDIASHINLEIDAKLDELGKAVAEENQEAVASITAELTTIHDTLVALGHWKDVPQMKKRVQSFN
jgi:uncharacterized protein YidB (DUF937 family)